MVNEEVFFFKKSLVYGYYSFLFVLRRGMRKKEERLGRGEGEEKK